MLSRISVRQNTKPLHERNASERPADVGFHEILAQRIVENTNSVTSSLAKPSDTPCEFNGYYDLLPLYFPGFGIYQAPKRRYN